MALQSRLPFRTVRGGMTFTGNTLGLSKAQTSPNMGRYHLIGAFINSDFDTQVDTYPNGTTFEYTENKSQAELVIPAGAVVTYAEVIWAGNSRTYDQDILTLIDNSIEFIDSDNNVHTLEPDDATKFRGIAAQTDFRVISEYYVRSCIVTDIVKASGGGTYSVGKVPSIIDGNTNNSNATNFAGWTLAVVYEDLTKTLKSVALYVGGEIVSISSGTEVYINIGNFSTPSAAPLNARILISSAEGDLHLPGDTASFAPTLAQLDANKLWGPRNLIDNFFASQITNDSGNLDQTGTFGDRNQGGNGTNVISNFYVDGARQGWDIINCDASSTLVTNQTSAVFRATTKPVPGQPASGDAYMPVAIGIQIEILDPTITVKKSANKSVVSLSNPYDTVEYTLAITNKGPIAVSNVIVKDPLPTGMAPFVGSVTVDWAPVGPTSDITQGVNIGTLAANETKEVRFTALVTGVGMDNKYINISNVTYTFVPAVNIDPVTTTVISNPVEIRLNRVVLSKVLVPSNGVSGDIVNCILTVMSYTATSENLVTDTLPSGTVRADGNVRIGNSAPIPGDITAGVQIGPLAAGASQTVSFLVQIV